MTKSLHEPPKQGTSVDVGPGGNSLATLGLSAAACVDMAIRPQQELLRGLCAQVPQSPSGAGQPLQDGF